MNLPQAAQYAKERFELAYSVREIMDGIIAVIEDFYYNKAELKCGVRDFIEKLYKNGVKMCVATASERKFAEAALKRNGILQYFSGVFTCTEIGASKEKPDIYYAALDSIATPKQNTVVFEDSLHAILTAKNAGFYVAAVYDEYEDINLEKIRAAADFYISSFENTEVLI